MRVARRVGEVLVTLVAIGTGLAGFLLSGKPQPQCKVTLSPPPKSQAETAAMRKLEQLVCAAAHPPKPAPGFKISRSKAPRLHGLDLWDAVVLPMVYPLEPLDGTPALRQHLDGPQYVAYVLFAVDTDIDDGGVAEVYYNSSGEYAEESVGMLRLIGAPMHAHALDLANHAVWRDGNVPASMQARRRVVLLSDPRFNRAQAAWDRAERVEGSIYGIVEGYIRAHPRAFFS